MHKIRGREIIWLDTKNMWDGVQSFMECKDLKQTPMKSSRLNFQWNSLKYGQSAVKMVCFLKKDVSSIITAAKFYNVKFQVRTFPEAK